MKITKLIEFIVYLNPKNSQFQLSPPSPTSKLFKVPNLKISVAKIGF